MFLGGFVFISSFLAVFGIFGSRGDGDIKIQAITSVVIGTFSAILAMVA